MVANAALMARVTDLVALFNRQSLDLPDGLFDRQTQFLLNGRPFESMLGRSPSDPLVLMIARGPAGYRFAIKALQHAIPDARVEIGEVEDTGHAEACIVPLWLSGQLRGTRSAVDVAVRVSIAATDAGTVTRADARIDPVMLEPIREARLRE